MTSDRPRPTRLQIDAAPGEETQIAALLGDLPDPRPDDLTVQQVWRNLRARPSPGHGRWVWGTAGGALACLLLVLGLVFKGHRQAGAELLLAQGDLFLEPAPGHWMSLRSGDAFVAPALLRTSRQGGGLVRLPGIAALLLGADTDLSVERLAGGAALRLKEGSVTARVLPRRADEPFEVRVGDLTVTVVGTLFAVSSDPKGQIAVSVDEGAVRVAGPAGSWRVVAGQTWYAEAPEAPTEQRASATTAVALALALNAPASPELPALFHEWAEGKNVPPSASVIAAPPAGSVSPPTEAPREPPATDPLAAPPRADASKTTVKRPRPERRESDASPPTVSPPPEPPTPVAEPPLVVAAVVPAEGAPAAIPPHPTAASPEAKLSLYQSALKMAREGSPQNAAALIEQALAQHEGPRDLELYELAILRARRLHDRPGALQAFEEYRQSFPAGALRQEVDLSIIDSQVALGRADTALGESAEFLSRYPHSERLDDVRILRGNLLRERGDCVRAVDEYRNVRQGPALDDALFFTATCHGQLGDQAAATTQLHEYLARFPEGHHAGAARSALGLDR